MASNATADANIFIFETVVIKVQIIFQTGYEMWQVICIKIRTYE